MLYLYCRTFFTSKNYYLLFYLLCLWHFHLFIIPSILKNYKIIEESLRESKKRKGKEELWRILHPNLSMDVSGHSAYSGPRGYVSSPKSNKKP